MLHWSSFGKLEIRRRFNNLGNVIYQIHQNLSNSIFHTP